MKLTLFYLVTLTGYLCDEATKKAAVKDEVKCAEGEDCSKEAKAKAKCIEGVNCEEGEDPKTKKSAIKKPKDGEDKKKAEPEPNDKSDDANKDKQATVENANKDKQPPVENAEIRNNETEATVTPEPKIPDAQNEKVDERSRVGESSPQVTVAQTDKIEYANYLILEKTLESDKTAIGITYFSLTIFKVPSFSPDTAFSNKVPIVFIRDQKELYGPKLKADNSLNPSVDSTVKFDGTEPNSQKLEGKYGSINSIDVGAIKVYLPIKFGQQKALAMFELGKDGKFSVPGEIKKDATPQGDLNDPLFDSLFKNPLGNIDFATFDPKNYIKYPFLAYDEKKGHEFTVIYNNNDKAFVNAEVSKTTSKTIIRVNGLLAPVIEDLGTLDKDKVKEKLAIIKENREFKYKDIYYFPKKDSITKIKEAESESAFLDLIKEMTVVIAFDRTRDKIDQYEGYFIEIKKTPTSDVKDVSKKLITSNVVKHALGCDTEFGEKAPADGATCIDYHDKVFTDDTKLAQVSDNVKCFNLKTIKGLGDKLKDYTQHLFPAHYAYYRIIKGTSINAQKSSNHYEGLEWVYEEMKKALADITPKIDDIAAAGDFSPSASAALPIIKEFCEYDAVFAGTNSIYSLTWVWISFLFFF